MSLPHGCSGAVNYLAHHAERGFGSSPVLNLVPATQRHDLCHYVSLIADARGQCPLPDVEALEDLYSGRAIARVNHDLAGEIKATFAHLDADAQVLGCALNEDVDGVYHGLAQRIFDTLRLPSCTLWFERHAGVWLNTRIEMACRVDETADIWLTDRRPSPVETFSVRRRMAPPSLAILHTPGRALTPSNPEALRRFLAAAASLNLDARLISRFEADRIRDFAGLLIRDHTRLDDDTYELSRQARDLGLALVDDPASILRCANKAFLFELLAHSGLPVPGTVLVHQDNVEAALAATAFPCVVKLPESSFSKGVYRANDETELRRICRDLFGLSSLLIIQDYLPTPYDWRIGIIDRELLFACKYHMVENHWQVVKHNGGQYIEGRTEAVDFRDVPSNVRETALAAADLIGDGFYGVDLKELGGRCVVIEINDNPNVDAGNEDAKMGLQLYERIMRVFVKRIGSAGR
ncbi:RimK-like ATPgrasp N-terminal domain-containing protein [Microvirga antarctica]|uniref:RimK-like ATPgrasp N-terminal domain-containing protein n=1 Tax=Microvirga antarctica TaxID=2819233 RepID=UPI001B30B911